VTIIGQLVTKTPPFMEFEYSLVYPWTAPLIPNMNQNVALRTFLLVFKMDVYHPLTYFRLYSIYCFKNFMLSLSVFLPQANSRWKRKQMRKLVVLCRYNRKFDININDNNYGKPLSKCICFNLQCYFVILICYNEHHV
jgi:hypothetical protein